MLLVRAPSAQSLSQGLTDAMTGASSAFHSSTLANGTNHVASLTGAAIGAIPPQNSLSHALTNPVAPAQALTLANYGQPSLNGCVTSSASLVAGAGLSQTNSALLGLTERAAAVAMSSQLSLKVDPYFIRSFYPTTVSPPVIISSLHLLLLVSKLGSSC